MFLALEGAQVNDIWSGCRIDVLGEVTLADQLVKSTRRTSSPVPAIRKLFWRSGIPT